MSRNKYSGTTTTPSGNPAVSQPDGANLRPPDDTADPALEANNEVEQEFRPVDPPAASPTAARDGVHPPMPLPNLCDNAHAWPAPNEEDCRALWDKYAMPEHIRNHSRNVCKIACFVAERAFERGVDVDRAAVRASALLHDIAKIYTIENGGHHGQIGGVWALEETGNFAVAQGVIHHIHWPWDIHPETCLLPLAVIYADKRVKHERIVPLDVRHQDLMDRYGKTELIRERIQYSMDQCRDIERALNKLIGTNLDASDFDSGRLE